MYERFQNGEMKEICREIGANYQKPVRRGGELEIDLEEIRKRNLGFGCNSEIKEGEHKLGEFSIDGNKFEIKRYIDYLNSGNYLIYDVAGKDHPSKSEAGFIWDFSKENEFPFNSHRGVDSGLRNFGLARIIFNLSEDFFSSNNENKIGFETGYSKTVPWIFKQDYVPQNPKEISFNSFKQIIGNDHAYEFDLDSKLKLVKEIGK